MARNSPRTKQNIFHRFTKRNTAGRGYDPLWAYGVLFLIWDDVFLFLGNALKMALFYVII